MTVFSSVQVCVYACVSFLRPCLRAYVRIWQNPFIFAIYLFVGKRCFLSGVFEKCNGLSFKLKTQ